LQGACAATFVCIACLQAATAEADSCGKSRDYILATASGELPRRPQTYQELYKSCVRSLELPNVKDAFILKSGAIAVIPRNQSIPATAATQAQFCMQFPRQTIRFITRNEVRLANNIARIVQLSTAQSTPCQKITGG
jgi:hypothetical protein